MEASSDRDVWKPEPRAHVGLTKYLLKGLHQTNLIPTGYFPFSATQLDREYFGKFAMQTPCKTLNCWRDADVTAKVVVVIVAIEDMLLSPSKETAAGQQSRATV
nr:hypothetical protein Iba_chr08aCG6510 [Ipomoea batatas]